MSASASPLDGACQGIQSMLKDFPELEDPGPFTSDLQYMQLNEAKYLIIFARHQLCAQTYQAASRAGSLTVSRAAASAAMVGTGGDSEHRKGVDEAQLAARRVYLDGVAKRIDEQIELRLKATAEAAPGKEKKKGRGRGKTSEESTYRWMPRLHLLCARYKLSEVERAVMHIITIVQGSNNPHVVANLSEEDYIKRVLLLRRLAGASEIDVENFCEPERPHCKEGLVTSEEEHGLHFNVRCSRTAVQILYGQYTTADDLLKVSQTALEAILQSEQEHRQALGHGGSHGGDRTDDGTTVTAGAGPGGKRGVDAAELPSPAAKKAKLSRQSSSTSLRSLASNEMDMDSEDYSDDEYDDEGLDPADESDSLLGPYFIDDQLEYLEEGFKIVALMVRTNAARLKDDMKKEGTKVTTWDGSDIRGVRRELQAKMLLTERRIETRLESTRKALGQPGGEGGMKEEGCDMKDMYATAAATTDTSADAKVGPDGQVIESEGSEDAAREIGLPRLEILAERLHLDAFERKMILLLIGKTVSPVVKALIDNVDQLSTREDVVTVGQALAILCPDFTTQIANRKYFYRSGKLLSNGIISLARSRWHQGSGDLTDQRITLDRRVLDWAVGLDSEINELVEGSDIYEPRVELGQVVLPPGHLDTLLKQCRAYAAFTRFRASCTQLNKNRMAYGNGLIILLCGKSGTGKTMTVNAVAKDLGKKVLLVDFGSLSGRKDGAGDLDADLRGLFREAHMSNAVLFFDECEAAFRSRDRGGDRLLNALLTEIERHEGIVFMATNRPHDIDEAMHRRITTVIPYASPDYSMRLRIWTSLLSTVAVAVSEFTTTDGRLRLATDVDIASLAVKYELTGGFIKNAILTAVLCALSRENESNADGKKSDESGDNSKKLNHNSSLEDAVNRTLSRNGGAAVTEIATSKAVLCQADLIAGCKLQMRGAMNIAPFEDQLLPDKSLDELHLSPGVKEAGQVVVRFEKARARVHGTWAGWAVNGAAHGSEPNNSMVSALGRKVVAQKCCLCAIAGPTGYGKRTFVRGVCYDLGRPIKMVHASNILGGGNGTMADILGSVEVLLRDARLADAVVAIDGFEHVLLDEGAANGGEGWKLHVLLSRLLGLLQEYPGCVFLVCHIENPQNINLQRDFASRLFCFIRQAIPLGGVRGKLWASLMPSGAPVSSDVNFAELGKKFELGPSSIQAAVQRACAEAAFRGSKVVGEKSSSSEEVVYGAQSGGVAACNGTALSSVKPTQEEHVRMKDLMAAGEIEVGKLRDQYFEVTSRMFS